MKRISLLFCLVFLFPSFGCNPSVISISSGESSTSSTSIWLLVGIFVTGLFGLWQIRINNVGKAKIEQLNDLRQRMSAYLLRSEAYKKLPTISNDRNQINRIDEEKDEARANLTVLLCSLNKKDPLQGALRLELISHFVALQEPAEGLEKDSLNIGLIHSFNKMYDHEWKTITSIPYRLTSIFTKRAKEIKKHF